MTRAHRLELRGSVASCRRHSRDSLVPRLPSPPSSRRSQPPKRTTRHVALSPSFVTSVAKLTTFRAPSSGVFASLIMSTTSWSVSVPLIPSVMRTKNEYSAGPISIRRISGSADTPMRFDWTSPKARVFAKPLMRSSPKESVTNVAAYRLNRLASIGDEG